MASPLDVEKAPTIKRARKSAPKSHNGCPTCKIRRVKCDETRPFCNRCVSTGRQCEGFPADPIVKKPSSTPSSSSSSSSSTTSAIALVLASPPQQQLTLSSFPSAAMTSSLSERETQHLNFFRFLFAPGLSGYASSPRWERLVLQAVHAEPAVRHAAIAVSALQLQQLPGCGGAGQQSDGGDEGAGGEGDRLFALGQYGKSVRALRELLGRGERRSIEAALVCSIMCICFEILEGSHLVAKEHLENSLRVLSSVEVDEDLSRAFARIDVQASSYIGRRVPALATPPSSSSIMSFRSIDDAEKELYQELNHIWAFLRGTAEDYRYRGRSSIPIHVVAEAQTIKQRISRWSEAFELFLSALETPLEKDEARHVKLLRIQHHTATVLMASPLHPEETIYDSYDDAFTSIVSLSGELLNDDTKTPLAKSFSMDLGIIQPLYITATKCRIAHVRDRAIRLLRAVPHREGIWSSQVLAQIAMRVREIEEAGLDPSFLETQRVPECRRVHAVDSDIDQKARLSGFSCRLRPDGLRGEWVDRTGFVTW